MATDVTKAVEQELVKKVEKKKKLVNMGADVEAVVNFFDNLAEDIKHQGEQRLAPYEETLNNKEFLK